MTLIKTTPVSMVVLHTSSSSLPGKSEDCSGVCEFMRVCACLSLCVRACVCTCGRVYVCAEKSERGLREGFPLIAIILAALQGSTWHAYN